MKKLTARAHHAIHAFFGLVLFIVLSVAFQNCGGGMTGGHPFYTAEEPTGCVGVSCGRDASKAEITFTNSTAIVMQNGEGSTSFDVGGYCDTGGFPYSYFVIELYEGITLIKRERRSDVSCDENGRFRLRVQLPTGYRLDLGHTLQVKMIVQNEDRQDQDMTDSSSKPVAVPPAETTPTPTPTPSATP